MSSRKQAFSRASSMYFRGCITVNSLFLSYPRKLSYAEEHGLFNYGVHLQIF